MQGFEFKRLRVPGVVEILPRVFADARGTFVKTFRSDFPAEYGIATVYAEEYYSVSKRGVLRGMHFQLPPHDHDKLVYCTAGEVLDAVLDLRVGSPTYGEAATVTLTGERANMLFIPRGCAHGFYTLSESATMMYKVTSVYAPQHDAGIRFDSAAIEWPAGEPIMSDRDKGFPALRDFASPFRYEGA